LLRCHLEHAIFPGMWRKCQCAKFHGWEPRNGLRMIEAISP
jgi:hypothetical protein